jgi:hypothetical protein
MICNVWIYLKWWLCNTIHRFHRGGPKQLSTHPHVQPCLVLLSSIFAPPFFWNFVYLIAGSGHFRDVDINTSDTSTPTHNQISYPITQAHVCQLNNYVSSFLPSYSSYLDNENVCSILLLRKDGQEGNGVAFASATSGFQNNNSLWRPPRPCMDLDSDVQILSEKLLESTFICIKHQVHIVSKPVAIVILVQRHFSTNGAATPYFGSLGRASCWVQFGRVLALEHNPASLRSSSHTYKT